MIACGDDPLSRLEPRLQAAPPALDFGDGCVGIDNEGTVTLRNLGEGPLDISEFEIEPGGVFRVLSGPDWIDAQQAAELVIVFRPVEPRVGSEATVVVRSNDPLQPSLAIPVTGTGGFRRILVEPATVDFGAVNEGTPGRRAIEVTNAGGSPLEIRRVTWTSTSVDLGPDRWPMVPLMLPAKTSTSFRMVYDPRDLGADLGTVTVESDDPDRPEVDVRVEGVANLAPRAVAWSCPAKPDRFTCAEDERRRDVSVGLGRVVRLDGLSSYDPEGEAIVEYEWSVVRRPEGSRAAVFHASDDRDRDRATGEIEVDRDGRYEIRLGVRDARGLSSDSVVRPEASVALRPRDLDVRISWDIATDVDLHFVRPGGRLKDYGTGRAGTSTGSDCSTYNRAPDWGRPGDPSDDPRLEKDDVSGRGPEVVSLDEPESTGPYVVYAHYCDSSDLGVDVNVVAEVRVRGDLIARVPASGAFNLLPGQVWAVAEISWRDGRATVTALEQPVASRPDLCRAF